MMKAAVLTSFGKPLALEQISRPRPGPGEILIRVAACGVCHTDWHIVRGEWESFKKLMSLPVVPGHEVTGTVEVIGPEVEGFQEGQPVGVPWFYSTCGRCAYCRRDLEVFCENSEITGVTKNGGFAEYMVVQASHCLPVPEELSLVQAAPLFCAGATVYSALQKISLNESVHLAVWGAGGLGQLGIQLGRLAKSRVTAVDTHAEKLEVARELGADEVVSFAEAKQWFTSFDRQADIALVCAPAAEAYSTALRSLRKNGTLIVVGLPPEPLSWTAADLVRSGTRVIPSRVSSRKELLELLALAARSDLHSCIDRFDIEEINRVFAHLGEGKIRGRAVIDFGSSG